MFLHGGWLHIGGNMLFLWVFGNNVEDRLGYLAYPLFYVLGGLAAAGLQIAFAPDSTIPSLGASGAIGAVLGAYAVLFPNARVTTLVIFFFITVVEVRAILVLGVWFLLQLFSGAGQLGDHLNGGVAYWAHVGGFGFGALVAWLLYRPRGGRASTYGVPGRPDLVLILRLDERPQVLGDVRGAHRRAREVVPRGDARQHEQGVPAEGVGAGDVGVEPVADDQGAAAPARRRPASNSGANGLPTTSASAPVVSVMTASRAPAPGHSAPGAGNERSGFVAMRCAPRWTSSHAMRSFVYVASRSTPTTT